MFGGGIIPEADIPELVADRRGQDLHAGRHDKSIVDWVRENVATPVA